MNVSIETITPDLAAEMLKKNTHNRPMRERHVAKLAREMEVGHWQMNGDAIRFNHERLIDGQHRLAAIVKSGVTVEALIVRDIAPDVFATIDSGARRSASDALALKGEINTHNLASVLRLIERYKAGKMGRRESTDYTIPDVLDFLSKYPNARCSCQMGKRLSNVRNLAPLSVVGSCHFLFAELDEAAANDFFERLWHGGNLDETDPVFILREKLVDNVLSAKKLGTLHIMALIIKAWNATRKGEEIKVLRWRETGPMPEPFPTVV